MSYDIFIGSGKKAIDCGNYTYNVAPMYYDVIDGGINSLKRLTGKKAQPILEQAIAKLESDPDKYKAMNPDNGWGDYEGAIQFLRDILNVCKLKPRSKITVC